MSQKVMPTGKLGDSQLQASRMGYGCMGLSAFYTTNPISEEEALNLIGECLNQGINFFDTAAIYGDNELLLAKAIKKYGRDKFILATKVGFVKLGENGQMEMLPRTKALIKEQCDISLKRLEIDYIDLYYQHRVDQSIPIEEQAQAFKELIQEGKIKHYGLSEASAETIRRAHKIHPVTAVQEEFSLFTRDLEFNGVYDVCKELGIAIVPYSPLGRGVLTGTISNKESLSPDDWRLKGLPRFEDEAMQKNNQKVEELRKFAQTLNATPGQIALSWLLAKGDNIFPIPGTKRVKYLTENNDSAYIKLSQEQVQYLDNLFPQGVCQGQRYDEAFMTMCTANTV